MAKEKLVETQYQRWLLAHDPEDTMIWKKSFWNYNIFWRDTIADLFIEYENKYEDSTKNLNHNNRRYDSMIEVIGTHWSKSIENPVLRIIYRGVAMVFRYNFYDYEIAVIGDIPIILPERLIPAESFFYQGFPKEYQLEERYTHGATKFICGCNSHYEFYTLMFLLRECIDNYYAAQEE